MRTSLLGALLGAVLLPAAAHAQSLFSTHGLGVPLVNVDARAHALGVNGVGLAGLSTTLLNPAEAGGTVRRGVSATFQPWSGTAELNGQQASLSGTRFPLLTVLYPLSKLTFTFGYAGMLDQSWAVLSDGFQRVGTDSVPTHDVVRSVGGIGELKVGAAYMASSRLSLGVQAGFHTGSIERSTRREFPDSTLLAFENRTRWDYTGPLVTAGFRFDPSGRTRIGASATWSATLEARPKDGSTTTYKYDLPLRIAAGASTQLSPRLMVALSSTLNGYGSGDYTAPGTNVKTVADRAYEVGGGVEWQELRSGERVFPLRAGFRLTRLPFHNVGESQATERAFTGGIGFRLVQDDYGPLAVADIGFERGKRDGWKSPTSSSGLAENFWRFSVSMSLFGR